MAFRMLATQCKSGKTCPGDWADDENPEDIVVIGVNLDPSPVPLGPGEAAVRLRRQTVRDADLEL